jgi:CrcB protein
MSDSTTRELPADSDVDMSVRQRRPVGHRTQWSVILVISVGGAIGALARYGLGIAFPAAPMAVPWTTLAINTAGCFLIGALMVLVTQVWAGWRLIRPFLGVGVLGGFTTFSTYVVDIQRLVDVRATGTALAYLAGTILAALAATYSGLTLTRWAITRRRNTVAP